MNSADLIRSANERFETFYDSILPVIIFIGVEIVLGTIGNCFVLYVFGFRYEESTYRVFALHLAATDLFSCLLTMPAEIVAQRLWFAFTSDIICRIKMFANAMSIYCDVYCLLAITVDRYKQVCLPSTTQVTPALAKFLCVGIVWTSLLLSLMSFTTGTIEADDVTNITVTICWGRNHNPIPTTMTVIQSVTIFIPVIVMIILYVNIARTLFRRFSGSTEEERGLLLGGDISIRQQTVVMGVVSLLFALTIYVYGILCILFGENVVSLSAHETTALLFFLRLYFINHVINPIVFGCMDPHFRAAVRQRAMNE